ncbi:MAG: hypothetical protein ACP5O7_11740 [Phycisphaerae bacterium]
MNYSHGRAVAQWITRTARRWRLTGGDGTVPPGGDGMDYPHRRAVTEWITRTAGR